MDVTLATKGPWIVVGVKGRIDAFNYELLSTRLSTLRRVGKKQIAIDLSKVSFLGIPAARLLASYAKSLSSSGGNLVVVTEAKRLLDLLHLFIPEKRLQWKKNLSELESLNHEQN